MENIISTRHANFVSLPLKISVQMNVLVLGSGGREHALGWKVGQSSLLRSLFFAPGNPGTASIGTNLDVNILDFEAVKQACLEHDIDVLLVGPEQPLVEGIADFFAADDALKKVLVIGPSKQGAQLEGSKAFAKAFMQRHNIPTAAYQSFGKKEEKAALAFLETLKPPYVLKADGLAAGKGVVIVDSLPAARKQLKSMFAGEFGEAGHQVVIEEFLNGVEMSVFVLTDGNAYKVLPAAKDYKRVGEGDTGPNTGGMGAVSPVPFARPDLMGKIHDRIIVPTINGLRSEEISYNGFLFIGLMIVKNEPYVIEYNVRMGDPETEVVMPRLKSDLLDMFEGIATGTLSERHVEVDERTAATVMLVSGGYPGSYAKGKTITGLDAVSENVLVFQAGTAFGDNDSVQTSGGRVVAITAFGKDLERALGKAYEAANNVQFEGKSLRTDIGQDLLEMKVGR